jgi:hypothetical protein
MAAIVISFAVLVTVHLALVAGLAVREPRTRGLIALVVPPLAPYWGMQERMRARAVVWGLAFVVYVGARVAERVMAG